MFSLWWFLRDLKHLPKAFRLPLTNILGGDTDLPLLLFVATIPLIFLIVRTVETVAFDLIIARRRRTPTPPLLREVTTLVLYIILIGVAFSSIFQKSLTGLFTTSAVLAAVLGLALQDTLGNLFSGIALHMEDTFDVGDVVRSGEFIGTVEEVSWRATRLRTFSNDIAVLPNSILARERLEVFPRNSLNARTLQVSVDYHLPPATVIEVLTQAASHIDGVANERPATVRVGGFTDSATLYDIKYFVRDYALSGRIDADIRKAVWYAMRRNALTAPSKMRTVEQYAPALMEPEKQLDRKQLMERLAQVDLLSPLTEGARAAIADVASVRYYSKGETIIRRRSAGDSMFVVFEGIVAVRVPDRAATGGHEIAQLGPGSVVGEMALLTGAERTADVIAVTDVTLVEIGKAALQPVLHDHPEFVQAMSAKIAERQEHLQSLRAETAEEAETTMLSRIRSYFGL